MKKSQGDDQSNIASGLVITLSQYQTNIVPVHDLYKLTPSPSLKLHTPIWTTSGKLAETLIPHYHCFLVTLWISINSAQLYSLLKRD